MFAYLDAASNVVATSVTEYTLGQAQEMLPSIASIIADAPSGLVPVGQQSNTTPYYHRWVSGDGTNLSDYAPADTYTYSIEADTANGKINRDVLALEIKNSQISAVLNRIGIAPDLLMLVFDASLDAGDLALLDGVVAAHEGAQDDTDSVNVIKTKFVQVDSSVSTTAQSYVTLLSANIQKSDYRSSLLISVSFSLRMDRHNSSVSLQLAIDEIPMRHIKVNNGVIHEQSGSFILQVPGLAAGNHSVALQWAVTGNASASIRPSVSNGEHASMLVQEMSV
jgi:hypothetical protein